MICLNDNDFIKKLAACNLIHEALELLGVTDDDVLVLPTAQYFFRHPKKRQQISEDLTPETLKRIDSAMKKWQVCRLEADDEDSIALDIQGIDDGERAFLAVRAEDCILATGDRKCLLTLADKAKRSGGRLAQVHERWKGRVVWFEQLLLELIRKHGESIIWNHIWLGCACDYGLLNHCFRSGRDTPVEDVIKYLETRVKSLNQNTDGLLRSFGGGQQAGYYRTTPIS